MSGEEAANVCGDGSRGWVGRWGGLHEERLHRGLSEKRAIRGWGTAAQSS